MKKIISLLMSLIMLLSITMGMNLTAFADEKQVVSFDLNPVNSYTIYQGAYDTFDEDGDGRYYLNYFNNNDELVLNYSDNSTEKFYYSLKDEEFKNGNRVVFLNNYDFYFDGLGETAFTTELEETGIKKEIPITVVENPYKSFKVLPTPFDVVDNGGEDFYQPKFYKGCTIEAKLANNIEMYEWLDGDLFVNSSGEYLYAGLDSLGRTETSTLCHIYTITDDEKLKILGLVSLPITIIENPVDTFELIPTKTYEISGDSVDDSGKGWCSDLPEFNEGDIINLKYIDGNIEKFVFKNEKFRSSSGNVVDAEFTEIEPATPGETTIGTVKLTRYYKSTTVKVKITNRTSSGGSTGGGAIGGGGGFVPTPAPEDTDKKDDDKKPETKPNETTPAPSTSKKPATVVASKPQAKQKAVVVTWKPAKDVDGYEVQVATDKKFKKNKKTVTVAKQNASKKTVKKLKAKKKYFVRVRAYKTVNGKKSYGKWSKIKSVKTK